MKKILFIFLCLNSLTFSKTLNLEESINLSLSNSNKIKISEKNLEISKLKVNKAIKKSLPTVTYNGKYIRTEQQVHNRAMYSQGITISQPLFTGGAIMAGIKGANSYKNITNYMYIQDKVNLRLEVIKIYFEILNSEKNLVAVEESEKILNKNYEKQKVQLNLGLITKTDILKTEYSILEVEAQKIALRNKIDIDKEKLKLKLGINKDEEINLEDTKVPEDLISSINFEEDLKNLKNTLAYKMIEENNNIAKVQKMASASSMLPQVSAFAKYGADNKTTFKKSYEEANWVGGIEVNWKVFSFGEDLDAYKIAKLEEENQKLKGKDGKDNLEFALKEAYFNLLRFEKLKNSNYKASQAAKLNFELDQEKYEAGLISTVDYLMSENDFRKSAVEYNKALSDYYYAFEKYRSLLI